MKVQLYASARTAAGVTSVAVNVAPGGTSAARLIAELATRYPKLRRILASSRFLRNDEYLTDLEERVCPGDLFAVHPPYGGG